MRNLMQCAQAALTYSPDDASIISDAAEELDRLRARVAELERTLRSIADYCDEGHREPFDNIADAVRASLKETAP